MSQIKRYDCRMGMDYNGLHQVEMEEYQHGDYILSTDYDQLQSENASMREELKAWESAEFHCAERLAEALAEVESLKNELKEYDVRNYTCNCDCSAHADEMERQRNKMMVALERIADPLRNVPQHHHPDAECRKIARDALKEVNE